MKAYADLGDLPEDDQIEAIGQLAQDGRVIGFFVDDDAKAERYLTKLHARFKITVQHRGPFRERGIDCVFVRIGPLSH